MGIVDCGIGNRECGKDAKQSSRIFEAVPLFICNCRICAIPHSAFPIPYSPLPAIPLLSSGAFARAAASNKALILSENW
jgi:hypothetical protein